MDLSTIQTPQFDTFRLFRGLILTLVRQCISYFICEGMSKASLFYLLVYTTLVAESYPECSV